MVYRIILQVSGLLFAYALSLISSSFPWSLHNFILSLCWFVQYSHCYWPCSFTNICAKTMDGFSGQHKPGVLALFHLPWKLFPWLTGFQGATRQSCFLWKLCLSSFCQMHSFCSYVLVLVGEILPLAMKIGYACCLVTFSSHSAPWFSWFFAYLQIKSMGLFISQSAYSFVLFVDLNRT